MGFASPKEWREALVASEPDRFLMPSPSDMRYRSVQVRLDAWRMCVPKKVSDAYGRASSGEPASSDLPVLGDVLLPGRRDRLLGPGARDAHSRR
jgi:hypothetical protein